MICVQIMFHCHLYIARKTFEKVSPELHKINIPRQSVIQKHVSSYLVMSTHVLSSSPAHAVGLVRLTFVCSITLTSTNYDMHVKYFNWNTLLDFAEGLSLATSESTFVLDLPEG